LRVAGRVLAVLLALELVYLGVANGIARSNLVKDLVKISGQFQLDYASAYTLWPGHLHVKNVRLLAEDYNVQFSLEFEQVSVRLILPELLFRKVHVTAVEASGTRFRFRHKVVVVGDDADRLAAYPPIPGFADPPLYRGLRPPPIPDDEYALWEVRAEKVDASITELWGLEYRFRGRARAVGSFVVRPARWVQVEPASLTLETGTLTMGDELVASEVKGRVTCSVPDMDVQASEGLDVLKDISATIKVDLSRGELGFLNVYLPPAEATKLSGQADWAFDINVQRAVIQVGSIVSLEAKPLAVSAEFASLSGGVSLQVARKPQALSAVSFAFSAPLITVSKPKQQSASPTLEQVEARLQVETVDLTKEPVVGEGRLAVRRALLPSLAWLDEPGAAYRGTAEAVFEAKRDPAGITSGELALKLSEGRLAKDDFVANGQLRSHVTFVRGASPNAPLRLPKAQLSLSQVSIRSGEKRSEAFGAIVDASGFEISASEPPSASGAVSIHVTSAEALLPLVLGGPLKGIASTALDLGALTAQAAVTLNAAGFAVKGLHAKSGNMKLKGYLSSRTGSAGANGAFLVTAGFVNVGVTLQGGSTEVSPFVGDDWLAGSGTTPSKDRKQPQG